MEIRTTPVEPAELPGDDGAYFLEFSLGTELTCAVGALGERSFPEGVYRYVGSAYGPGGLQSRVSRHLRQKKRRHWHIDYLTAECSIIRVGFEIGADECEVVNELRDGPWHCVSSGFGASDCSDCPSHLLRRQ